MRASVVIPTCNRLTELQRVLAAVGDQWQPPGTELEVVVVDDGSRDGTWDWLESQAASAGWLVLRQDNRGPAVARNRGVESSSGDVVLFLGDDTVPQAGWLAAHLDEHRLFGRPTPLAVLGYTSFPASSESPFLRFINEYGAQFGYSIIETPAAVPFNFFYTSNISLPRSELIRHGGFREDFPAAAWEDIEFAYRAQDAGLTIRYQPRARTVHEHCIRTWTFCRRQRTSGLSAAIFFGLHPELGSLLGVQRLGERGVLPVRLRALLLWLVVEFGERIEGIVPDGVYQEFLDLCYQQGLAAGLHRE
jgi:GT2 family glycosyltransferase